MGYLIGLIVLGAVGAVGFKVYTLNKTLINFYIEGLDNGFGLADINSLWKCAVLNTLDEPNALYISASSLTKCITQIKAQAELAGNDHLQSLLARLYSFRNKLEKTSEKTHLIDSTMGLSNGQPISVIFPGKGVFKSTVVGNGGSLLILLPTADGKITIEGKDWVGHQINVYLWRKGDAQYVFDTNVASTSIYMGKPALNLNHCQKLLRNQKRSAVRADCHIPGQLFILRDENIDYERVETRTGYRCVLEDISETGALIKIGGKGVADLKLRVHLQIFNKLVVMFGVVKSVQYDEEQSISHLHFQCLHIDDAMKNQVLAFVYKILPEDEKEVVTAMQQIEKEEKADKAERGVPDEKDDKAVEEAIDEEKSLEDEFADEKEETAQDVIHKLDNDNALPDLEEM